MLGNFKNLKSNVSFCKVQILPCLNLPLRILFTKELHRFTFNILYYELDKYYNDTWIFMSVDLFLMPPMLQTSDLDRYDRNCHFKSDNYVI